MEIIAPEQQTNVVLGNLYDYVPWGRILKMTYPDGEQVRYFHSYGGDLFRICLRI